MSHFYDFANFQQHKKYFETEWFGFWNEFPENESDTATALLQKACFGAS